MRGLLLAVAVLPAPLAQAATADLDSATALVREGRYQEAYHLLLPERDAQAGAVEAHLALGRALFAQGRFGEARLQFETVLQFHELPSTSVPRSRSTTKRQSGTSTTACG